MSKQNQLKALLKAVCPPAAIAFVNRFRPSHQRWAKEQARKEREIDDLRKAHEALNAGKTELEFVMRNGVHLRLHPDSVEPCEYFCYRSPEMVRELDFFINHIDGCSRFMDIGALHGTFSLVFAKVRPGATIVAVDTSPIAFARLLYNVHSNDLGTAITPVECALSDRSGTLRMHYEWEHAVAAPLEDGEGKSLWVEMKTGDDVCESLTFLPDAIKIDVEGHEVKVLRGLRRVLSEARPRIFLEVHPARIIDEGDSGHDILELFESLRYFACNTMGKPVRLGDVFTTDDRLYLSPLSH